MFLLVLRKEMIDLFKFCETNLCSVFLIVQKYKFQICFYIYLGQVRLGITSLHVILVFQLLLIDYIFYEVS
jgi:hypothetical protein